MPLELVPNWRRVLLRSAAVWFNALGQFLFIVAGVIYLLAERLGNDFAFWLSVAVGCLGMGCFSVVPVARIIKQPRLHDADQ